MGFRLAPFTMTLNYNERRKRNILSYVAFFRNLPVKKIDSYYVVAKRYSRVRKFQRCSDRA